MKLFVLYWSSYEDFEVCGVVDSECVAKEWADKCPGTRGYEVAELNKIEMSKYAIAADSRHFNSPFAKEATA